ncbi:MAG TPA: TetR/AcrR family transcriptional regulator, partial [Mycobacterium sp.]|nr:TetR/AcrR family transcriptional regulator [Mycobacterium sp.]
FLQDRFAAERGMVDRIERVIAAFVEDAQREGDVRPIKPVSASRLVQSLFDALALPDMSVSPAEILEFAMIGLLADASRLPEIRTAAAALAI